MAKTRYIPYGYTMRDGIMVVEMEEAEIVKKIFDEYISGMSLKDIADMLSERRVPYTEKKSEWNKSRVARIIENSIYIGAMDYEPIIDESTFESAVSFKQARKQQPKRETCLEILKVRDKVKCSKCGYQMIRDIHSKASVRETWKCTNEKCSHKVKLSDVNLLSKVTILINRITDNTELLTPRNNIETDSPSLNRLSYELKNELDKEFPSEDVVLEYIRRIACERYSQINGARLESEMIIKKIKTLNKDRAFNPEAFESIVSYIELVDCDNIIIHTKTKTIV